MSAPQKSTAASDTEEPVRNKLERASIDAGAKDTSNQQQNPDQSGNADDSASKDQNGIPARASSADRGRSQRKRSHDNLEADSTQEKVPAQAEVSMRKRSRKRSRGGSAGEKILNRGRASMEGSRGTDDFSGSEGGGLNGRSSMDDARGSTPSSERAGDEVMEGTSSPKIKRSRREARHEAKPPSAVGDDSSSHPMPDVPEMDDTSSTATMTSLPKPDDTTVASTKVTTTDPTLPSAPTDTRQEKSEILTSQNGKGFSDTSVASPFSTVADSKSPSLQPQTSSSAFAASGFGALSGSSSSGFGALNKSSGLSSFAAPSTTAPSTEQNENLRPTASTFGGSLGSASPFASAGGSAFGGGAGFGTLGSSGFGGGFGGSGGSRLSTFGGAVASGFGSSSRPTRAFGAPLDEEKEEGSGDDDDEAGVKSPRDTDEKKDERFFEQDVETGEEHETMEFSCRAKLYNFVTSSDGTNKKEWKERGAGVLKLNVSNPPPAAEGSDSDSATSPSLKARMVMRADGSHRVILNTPIKTEIKFGSVTGEAPQSGFMYFMGSVGDGALQLLQLKMKVPNALALYDRILDLQREMSGPVADEATADDAAEEQDAAAAV